MNRTELLRCADDAVVEFARALRARGTVQNLLPGTDLTILDAARTHLVLRLAECADSPAVGPLDLGRTLVRGTAEVAARWAASRLEGRRLVDRGRERRVMLMPRQPSHLRDLIPVAKELHRRGHFVPVWLTYRAGHDQEIARSGQDSVLASTFSPSPRRYTRAVREVLRQLSGQELAMSCFDAEKSRLALDVARVFLVAQLPAVLQAVDAVDATMRHFAPKVLVLAHPCTLEAAIAGRIARSRGTPVVVVQPSQISPKDTTWWPNGAACVCAWSELSRRALCALNFQPEGICVTGAVWTDVTKRVSWPQSADTPPRVVVAVSGPGHAVAHREHDAIVNAVVSASRGIKHARFEYRLHPKDSGTSWRRALQTIPGARGVVHAAVPGRPDISTQLRGAAVLVTGASTAGVDALYAGVPVITLSEMRAGDPPPIAKAGASVHVSDVREASVAAAIMDVIERTPVELAPRVRAYLEELLGPCDGHAARRVADAVEHVASGKVVPSNIG